jgi:hypothetical protein
MTLPEVVGPNTLPEILEIELRQTGFKSENGSLNRQISTTTNGTTCSLVGGISWGQKAYVRSLRLNDLLVAKIGFRAKKCRR